MPSVWYYCTNCAFWVYNTVTWIDNLGFVMAILTVRSFRRFDQFRSPWQHVHAVWVRLLGMRKGDLRMFPHWVYCFSPFSGRRPVYLAVG